MMKSLRADTTGAFTGAPLNERDAALPRSGTAPRRAGMRKIGAGLVFLTIWLFAFSASGAVIMESNGTVTSIGVPKGEGQSAEQVERDRAGATDRGEESNDVVYPSLPWGIVPEVHLAWPPHEWGGGQRPSRPPQWNGGGHRPGEGWNRPPHGNGPRPPHAGWESGNRPRPPHAGGWQGENRPGGKPGGQPPRYSSGGVGSGQARPGYSMGGQGSQGQGAGSPGHGPAPQMVRPPLGSAHIPGGGRPGGSAVLLPSGR